MAKRRRRLPFPDFCTAQQPCHQAELQMTVAFRDCDPMGVLWHGNYLAYCEAARHHLGEQLGWSVERIKSMGLMAPVVRSQVLHFHPALPERPMTVRAELYPTDQPRLYHRYLLESEGHLVAEGETEQVLVDGDFQIQLTQPPALADLLRPAP